MFVCCLFVFVAVPSFLLGDAKMSRRVLAAQLLEVSSSFNVYCCLYPFLPAVDVLATSMKAYHYKQVTKAQ